MAPAARSAFRKFTFDLDPQMVGARGQSEHADAPPHYKAIVFAIPPETARTSEHLDTLSDALLRRKRVTFTYHGIHRNEETERKVRPYGLRFKHSHWYLVGWDDSREAERIFRMDRRRRCWSRKRCGGGCGGW